MHDGSARGSVVHSRPVLAKITGGLAHKPIVSVTGIVRGAEAQIGADDVNDLFHIGPDDVICFLFGRRP